MVCKSCGAEIPEGIAFCPSCGTAVEQPLQNPETQFGGTDSVVQNLSPQAPAKKPKNKKKLLIILAIIVAVVVAIGALLFAIKNTIIRTVLGEPIFYAYSEYNTFKEFLSDDEFKALLNVDEINIDADGTLTNADYDDPLNVEFKGAYSGGDKKATASATLEIDGEKQGPLNVNYGNGKISFDGEDFLETAITVSAEGKDFDFTNAIQLCKDIAPIIQDCESSLKDNDCLTVSKEDIDGKRRRVVTLALTEKDVINLAADFLEAVKEEEVLEEDIKNFINDNKDILDTILETEGTDTEEFLEYLDEGIQEIDEGIRELRSDAATADDKETIFEYKIAYDGGATVYQREINVDNVKMTITTDISSKEKVFKLDGVFGNDGVNVEFVIEKSGKTRNARFEYIFKDDYSSNDEDAKVVVNAKDIKLEKVGGVKVPVGNIDYDYSDNGYSCASGSVSMTAGDKYAIDFEINDDDEAFLAGKINAALSNNPDFSDYKEPKSVTGTLEDLFESFSFENPYYEYYYGDYYYGDYYYDDYYDDYDDDYDDDFDDDYDDDYDDDI